MIPQPEFVWLCIEAVDMRLGIDGLSLRIQQTLGKTPCDGSAYANRHRRGNRIKLLMWDGRGVWLCQRRIGACEAGANKTLKMHPKCTGKYQ